MLVSAIHQHESATGPLPHEPPSHLPPHHSPLGCHRALGGAPCVTQHILMATYFTNGQVFCFHATLSIRPTLSFPRGGSLLCWQRHGKTVVMRRPGRYKVLITERVEGLNKGSSNWPTNLTEILDLKCTELGYWLYMQTWGKGRGWLGWWMDGRATRKKGV